MRLAERITGHTYLALDFPPTSETRGRWGHGRPEHSLLADILGQHEAAFRESLEMINRYDVELRAIEGHSPDPAEPSWINGYLPELDAAALYSFLREGNPARYVEVGSGNSTLFAARARRDGDLRVRLTSIDPEPRVEIDALCDEVVRAPFETADLSLLTEQLQAGDVVFFDGTHRTFMNSDPTVLFLDALPHIPAGVLVGVHDIFLPLDYPPEHWPRHYSEQYLLAAWLLGGSAHIQPILASQYVANRPDLYAIVAEIWSDPSLVSLRPEMNSSFWFTAE